VDPILPISIMLMTDINNGANGNGVVKARTLVRKKHSKGRDVISIESRTHPECYVLLNREDLLTLQKLEYCIRDSVTRRTLITLPAIVKQASCMVIYLKTTYGRHADTRECMRRPSHVSRICMRTSYIQSLGVKDVLIRGMPMR